MADLYRDPYARLEALSRGENPDAADPPSYPTIVSDQATLDRAGRVAANEGRSETQRAFRKGTEGIKSAGQSALGLARIALGDEEGGLQDLREAQSRSNEAAEFGPRIQSVDQVEGVGDAFEYGRNMLAEQVPNIALTVGTGGVGGAARIGAGAAAKQVGTRVLAKETASQLAKRAAFDQGAKAGAAAGGALLQSNIAPDIVLDPDGEGSVGERAAKAAVGAVATGAIEALPVAALFRRYGLGQASEAVTGGVLARVAKQGAKQGAAEAGTELAQTVGEKLAHKWVNDNVQVIGPEAYGDYINAMAAGFIGGGAFGAPAGLRGSGKAGPGYANARASMEKLFDKLDLGPEPMQADAPTEGGPDAPKDGGTPFGGIDVSGLGKGVAAAMSAASKKYAEFFSKEERSSNIDSALEGIFDEGTDSNFDALLSGEDVGAYGYKTDESGVVDLNKGAGTPYARFVDTSRARQYKDAGLDTNLAAVMATVPEQHVDRLKNEGVFGSVLRSLSGDVDGADKKHLQAYMATLDGEGKKHYLRAVNTAEQLRAEDAQFADTEVGQPLVEDTDANLAESTKEEEALRKPLPASLLRGTTVLREGANPPPGAYVATDGKGRRRAGSAAQLGKAIQMIQQDPDFRDNTRTLGATDRSVAALAQVMGDMAEQGLTLDPASLKPGMELGKGWVLTQAVVAKIQNGTTGAKDLRADPSKFSLRMQTPNVPAAATNTMSQEQALNEEYGREQGVEEQRGEVDPADAGRALGPRSGVPRTVPTVSEEGRVGEAQAIDAKDDIDTDEARAEKKKYSPDAFNEIDQTIERLTGTKVAGDFNRRRDLYKDLLTNGKTQTVAEKGKQIESDIDPKTGRVVRTNAKRVRTPLGKRERAEVVGAYRRYLEASMTAAEKKAKKARETWQANKGKRTLEALRKADYNVEQLGEQLDAFGAADERKQAARLEADKKVAPTPAHLRRRAKRADVDKKRLAKEQATHSVDSSFEARRKKQRDDNERQTPAGQRKQNQRIIASDLIASFTEDVKEAQDTYDRTMRLMGNDGNQKFMDAAARMPEDVFLGSPVWENASPAMQKLYWAYQSAGEDLMIAKQVLAANQKLYDDIDSTNNVDANTYKRETINSVVAGTRSMQELNATIRRILTAVGLSEKQRTDMLENLVARKEALSADLHAAGMLEIKARKPGTGSNVVSGERVDKMRRVFGNPTTNTMTKALRAAREFANAQQKEIIDHLLRSKSMDDIGFSVGQPVSTAGATGGAFYSFNRDAGLTGRVELLFGDTLDGNMNADPIQTLVHEALHAATLYAEGMTPKLRNDLKTLLDHVRTEAFKMGIDPNRFYGLTETQEFLSEAFSNPEIQAILKAMPAYGTDTFKNAWSQFVDILARMIGLDTTKVTALDEVLTLGLEAARITADARNTNLARVFDMETASHSVDSLVATPQAGGKPNDYINMIPPRERLYLLGAFGRADVRKQIEAALPPARRGELDSVDKGPELLLNTGIALALQNQLDLEKGAEGAIRQLFEVIRNVLGVPSKLAYARQIMADVRSQKVRKGYSVQAQLLKPTTLAATRFMETKILPAAQTFLADVDSRMRATGVPALTQMATMFSQRTGEFRADGSRSFIRRTSDERNKRLNEFFQITKGWDDVKKAAVARALQRSETDAWVERRTAPEGAKGYVQEFEHLGEDAQKVLGFLRDMRKYLGDSGLKMGTIESYFPVTIDGEAVAANKDDFIALMESPEFADDVKLAGGAEALYRQATLSTNGEQQLGSVTFADGQHDSTFKPLNKRLSAFVYKKGTPEQIAKFAEFQDSKLDRIMLNYVNRATRRAEWNRMGLGKRTQQLLAKAKEQGASEKQLNMAGDYIDQIMGSYGQTWHPMIKRVLDAVGQGDLDFKKFEKLQTALVTYQNLRLLPLALASSFIDPLGSAVRNGGDLKASFKSYRDGIRAFRDKEGNDALRAMAEDMGIIERHAMSEALIYMFGGANDPTGTSAKINAALFKWNGLESVTKYSRLSALANGQRFLIKHAGPNGNDRYLKELGLTKDDIKVAPAPMGYRGPPVIVRNQKIDAALARFVDESVVRPTAAQRPQWHNDPHFKLAAQYKGYLYSFWNTVVRRATIEAQHGNWAVLTPVLMYLPVTMVGEMLRDGLQGDDEDRELTDYAWLSVERSGLLGPRVDLLRNVGVDMSYGNSALNSVAGPTGQQIGQMYDAFNGRRNIGETVQDALPLSALHDDWFDTSIDVSKAPPPKDASALVATR